MEHSNVKDPLAQMRDINMLESIDLPTHVPGRRIMSRLNPEHIMHPRLSHPPLTHWSPLTCNPWTSPPWKNPLPLSRPKRAVRKGQAEAPGDTP